MGVDWCRMRVRSQADRAWLDRLIEQQALAFEAFDGAGTAIEPACRSYCASSGALEALLEFPEFDSDTGVGADDPDLALCWRVYPITENKVFPPEWRKQACQTFLPEELAEQIAIWKSWLAAVAQGQHRRYLLDLYLAETTTALAGHCRELQALAQESLAKTSNWATRPELAAVRDQILHYQTPAVHPAPPLAALERSELPIDSTAHPLYRSVRAGVAEFVSLARSWDCRVKGAWKVRYSESSYPTFEQFLDGAEDEWLHGFLAWAETCCARGMGLFLD